jgi:hypothetical protein
MKNRREARRADGLVWETEIGGHPKSAAPSYHEIGGFFRRSVTL